MLLAIISPVTKVFKSEMKNTIDASNKVGMDILDLYDIEYNILNSENGILNFFSGHKSYRTVDNEHKYFNTVGKNNDTLIKFCKKIKKLDKPKNSTFLFNRITREFINKKEDQIEKLRGDIGKIMSDMSIKDEFNHNLYSLRTGKDAQKQIDAIMQAKENIKNSDKLKINIK
jgi:hypothetical protein